MSPLCNNKTISDTLVAEELVNKRNHPVVGYQFSDKLHGTEASGM